MKAFNDVRQFVKLGLMVAAFGAAGLGQTVSSVILSPASAVGGVPTVANTVTLNGPAPAGGAIVTLQSSSASASVPATVTVPDGTTSAKFTITTTAVPASTTVTLSAAYGGVSKSATLIVMPVAVLSVILSPI